MYSTVEKRREWERQYYEKNKDEIRERKAAQMRIRRMKYPDTFRQQKMSYLQAMRQRLLDMYGTACAVCGYSDKRALTLDHINGDGAIERREFGERGVYRVALQEYQPHRYRTLCMNCQFIEHKERSKPQSLGDCSEANK